MSISEPFIRRPIATSLLMLGVLVFGIGAYNLLPVAALPQRRFPDDRGQRQLSRRQPDTMASSVATPLEQQFAAITGLAEMTSTSGVGTTTITLQFDLERNIDAAAQDVQQAINAATGLLPKDLPSPPTYRKTNPADRPVLIYAVHSDAMPIYRVDDYAYTILAQKLSTREGRLRGAHLRPEALCGAGPGQPGRAGGARHRPRGRAHRARDGHASTGRRAISKARTRPSRSTPTTSCSTPPASARSSSPSATARRCGSTMSPRSIDGVQNARTGAWFDGKPAEGLAIQREAGANTIAGGRHDQGAAAAAARSRSRPRCMSIWSPTARW